MFKKISEKRKQNREMIVRDRRFSDGKDGLETDYCDNKLVNHQGGAKILMKNSSKNPHNAPVHSHMEKKLRSISKKS